MKNIIGLATLFFLSACTTTPKVDAMKPEESKGAAERRSLMIGTWFGDTETVDGGRKMHIVDRYADGTMRIRFKVIGGDEKVFEQSEISVWGISGEIYFTATRGYIEGDKIVPADTSRAYLYDAYQILEINEDTFRYRHVSNGNEYQIDKVQPGFDFPI